MAGETVHDLTSKAVALFKTTFGDWEPKFAACAPGRVNLIGEHTDYNDGYVFPMAIECYTVIVGAKSDNEFCEIVTSANTGGPNQVKFKLPTPQEPLVPENAWADYVKGVITFFPDSISTFKAAVVSNVPLGGGLSSSASLEVAMYTFLEAISGKQHNPKEKALACQKAEHEFPGMPCGIMDQFISVMGKKDHALLLDCRAGDIQPVALQYVDKGWLIVVIYIKGSKDSKRTKSKYKRLYNRLFASEL
eukprot:gene16453-18084_t